MSGDLARDVAHQCFRFKSRTMCGQFKSNPGEIEPLELFPAA
jgi:hypothetical protein